MKSLFGFVRTKILRRKLERRPVLVRTKAAGTEIVFAVYTWPEYHNRARDSYTGEPDMVQWLQSHIRPGDVLWDVGANVGAYSLLAAKLEPSLSVVAFEPYIPTFSHLWENISVNHIENQVVPLCMALSDKNALSKLGVHDSRAGSSEHVLGGEGFELYQFSSAVTGDVAVSMLGVKAPTLIKIDVDGYEVNVLKGMAEILGVSTLRSCIVEVERGKTEANVDNLMRSVNFNRESDSSAVSGGPVFNVVYVRPT